MPFENDGTLPAGQDRPQTPPGWRQTRGTILHHMIDWRLLRETWNAMVRARLQNEIVRYMALIGYGNAQLQQRTVRSILNGMSPGLELADRDDLEMRLCWQRYNLFEGPPGDFRPPHSPDPDRIYRYFLEVGATTFDFPIVAQPHGQRANALWRAYGNLRAAESRRDPGAVQGELHAAFALLESVRQCGVIPAYEVNWFGLAKKKFWGMSKEQKRQFYLDCDRRPRASVNAEEVYANLFGTRIRSVSR